VRFIISSRRRFAASVDAAPWRIVLDIRRFRPHASALRRAEDTMLKRVLHGLIFIQTWGECDELLQFLKGNEFVFSVFHIMGRHSYLVDALFDQKDELEQWIARVRAFKLDSGVPAVLATQSNKVIAVYKRKEDFSLKNYREIRDRNHMFMMINNPTNDAALLALLEELPTVHSILHVQGVHSFMVELIMEDYENFRELLTKIKALGTVQHIETQEVINVHKYRNTILDEKGELVVPKQDIRELFAL